MRHRFNAQEGGEAGNSPTRPPQCTDRGANSESSNDEFLQLLTFSCLDKVRAFPSPNPIPPGSSKTELPSQFDLK